MRLLVTGLGGQLGTATARRLDHDPGVEILGIDIDTPRRHLERTRYRRLEPDDPTVVDLVREFDPEVVLHLGVHEPHARSAPAAAERRSIGGTRRLLQGLAQCPSLRHVIVRSGLEAYGRGRGRPLVPDETVPLAPSSRFGRIQASVETHVAGFARPRDIPVTVARCAPVVGPHVPSPLGRYLRLPVVPLPLVPSAPFGLLHADDAAAALAHLVGSELDEVVNLVGAGALTAWQAARMGNRLTVPVVGPGWTVARAAALTLGSPLPDHAVELLVRGRNADGGKARDLLGWAPTHTTADVIKELYRWATVMYLEPRRTAA